MQKIIFLSSYLAIFLSFSTFAQNKMQMMGINPKHSSPSESTSSFSHRVNLNDDHNALILKDIDKKTAANTKVTKAAYPATLPMNIAYTTTANTKRALWFRSKRK